MRIWEYWSN